MRCPSKKEWILFYYKDLDKQRIKVLEGHIKTCAVCFNSYAVLRDFLVSIKQELVSLKEAEFLSIVGKVTNKSVSTVPLARKIAENIGYFIQGIRWKLFYQPRAAFVVISVVVAALVFPVYRHHKVFERDSIDLQLDFALEGDDFDIFLDFYINEGRF